MMIRTLTALSISLGLGLAPLAASAITAPAPGPNPNVATADITPAMQLRMGVDSLLAFMNQEPRPASPAIARFLDSEIAPFFDFNHMARAAAGRFYLRLDAGQRAAMAEEIKRLFLTRLTEKLVNYGGQRVRYLRPRLAPDGRRALVSMTILDPGSYYPARIDFRLAQGPNGWAVIDIAANGQSAVAYYRQQMRRELMLRAYRQQRQPRQPR